MRSLFFVVAVLGLGSAALLSCSDPQTNVLFPDSGLGVGSSASSSAGGSGTVSSGSGGQTADAGEAASGSAEPTPCSTPADCVDDNLCNGTETCVFGYCQAGTPLSCVDGDPCTADLCAPATGLCSSAPLPDDSACQDDDRCDGQTCQRGVCTAGSPVVCEEDGNPCTLDACDRQTGTCQNGLVLSGASCEDGNRCNGSETCAGSICVAGAPPDCDDNNPCTADSCDAAAGCLNTTLPDGTSCSDGNLCNGSETCTLATCLPAPASTCDDLNPCTTDTCNPATGACAFSKLIDGTPCPDGNLCDGQLCANGACLDGPDVVCAPDNDGNVCTVNACVAATGQCARGNVADGTSCADADVCDGTETCRGGQCSPRGTLLNCRADTNPCTVAVCDPAWGCEQISVANGTPCPDADLCDGTETCTSGVCSGSGTPVQCDDGNACTSNDCSPQTGACVFTPVANGASCPDADLCDGTETCSAGVCSASGPPLVCDDGNPCTTNSCVPATGCLFTQAANGASCADADLCNGQETCSAGACTSGVPVICDDGNPCTSNACNPQTGACAFVLAADGSSCADSDLCDGSETCNGGVCSTSGVPLVCDDGNPCTTNSCVTATGCVFTQAFDGTSCSDADLCNGNETCSSGLCTAGVPVSCAAPQTCNPATGACGP